jgi:hypothetical protein
MARVATVATFAIAVCMMQALFPVWFNKFGATAEAFIEVGATLTLLVLLAGLVILILGRFRK